MLIPGNAQKVLKVLHLLAVSYWIGGALALLILVWASSRAQSGDELYGVLKSVRFVNVVVVVLLGALGSLFTGLAYSLCTNRGFFRHKWIILKWVITAYLFVVGVFLLGPWSTYMLETADNLGYAALSDPGFIDIQTRHIYMQVFEVVLFIIAIVLSVYKPWETEEIIRRRQKYLPMRVDG